MVNINSALLSMGRYLDMPTMGVGGSYTPSYLGWMPGLTGQTAYSFGPAPDDSLGSLVGNQLPSRSYLRFGSAENYRPGGPGASAPLASLNLPQLAAPSFGQQQQAAPPQVIGGQISFDIRGGNGAEGAGQTGTIADAVKEPFKKKLTERGYDPTEADRVISAVDKASGGDQTKFKQIMSNLPPPKPVAEAGTELTDAQKRDWAEKYADWFARNVGGITKKEEVAAIKNGVVPPAAPATDVTIKRVKNGEYEITSDNGTGDYAKGKYLYKKSDGWYSDAAGTSDKKVDVIEGSLPKGGGQQVWKINVDGKKHELTKTGNPDNDKNQKYVYGTGVNDFVLRKKDGTWIERVSTPGKPKVTSESTPARPGKLSIGGAKSGEDIADVARLTDRLEAAIEARREKTKADDVSKKDERSRAVKTAREAIRDALGATDATLKFKDDGKTLALTSDPKRKNLHAVMLNDERVKYRISDALKKAPGTTFTLDGTILAVTAADAEKGRKAAGMHSFRSEWAEAMGDVEPSLTLGKIDVDGNSVDIRCGNGNAAKVAAALSDKKGETHGDFLRSVFDKLPEGATVRFNGKVVQRNGDMVAKFVNLAEKVAKSEEIKDELPPAPSAPPAPVRHRRAARRPAPAAPAAARATTQRPATVGFFERIMGVVKNAIFH